MERRLPQEFELPPLDYGRPAGGVGGYHAGPEPVRQEPVVAPRPVSQGRRPARHPSEFQIELGAHAFEEEVVRKPFPVALVALLVVIVSGAGYLSWRMGLWGPAEDLIATSPAIPAQIAKVVTAPPLNPELRPVASLGQSPVAARVQSVPSVPAEILPAPSPAKAAPMAVSVSDARLSPIVAPTPPAPPVVAVAPTKESPAPVGEAPKVPDAPVTSDSPPLDRARNVVRRFLEAENWKDRVGLIEVPGDPASVLATYYKDHPDLAIENYRLDFFHNESRPGGGGSAYIFFLTFANEVDGFPVMVMERNGEYRLDWNLYTEFRGRSFQRFVEEMPKESAKFRVVLQRVTYWETDRDDIPGVDQLLCYKIDPPYPGFTRFAFLDRETPIGKQMARELSWEADPLAAEVELKWAEFPGGKRYLTVEQLISRSWVRGTPATVAQPSASAEN